MFTVVGTKATRRSQRACVCVCVRLSVFVCLCVCACACVVTCVAAAHVDGDGARGAQGGRPAVHHQDGQEVHVLLIAVEA